MINIIDLKKTYEDKLVLEGISLQFPSKGIVRIMGESGRGKTTLLRIIAGLDTADSGTVEVNGTISMVFQEDRLLPYISALDNVKLVSSSDSIDRNPEQILNDMGLGEDLHTRAGKLSGGMARRVAIARALAKEADIYIMDEPIQGLDASTTQDVISAILKYTAGKLLIIVTHSEEEFTESDLTINL